MELRVATDEAREHVVLELWMDGKPLGHINFDGATVEKHIQDVGDMRAELNETVTPELDPGSRLKAIVGPSWKVEDYRVPEGRIISLRHPGLGWLTFILSEDSAREMVKQLTRDLPVRTW
jgi:hypothetical protein